MALMQECVSFFEGGGVGEFYQYANAGKSLTNSLKPKGLYVRLVRDSQAFNVNVSIETDIYDICYFSVNCFSFIIFFSHYLLRHLTLFFGSSKWQKLTVYCMLMSKIRRKIFSN